MMEAVQEGRSLRKACRLRTRRWPQSLPLCRPLAECPWFTRWLYGMLLLIADGQGRLEWDPEAVRQTLLPYDKVTAASVANAARRLEAAGLLRFYEAPDADGRTASFAVMEDFRQFCRALEPSKLPEPPAAAEEEGACRDSQA